MYKKQLNNSSSNLIDNYSFLGNIQDRSKDRKKRKKVILKFAQEKEFKLGDQVKIIRDEPYDPIEAVVLSVSKRDWNNNVEGYLVRFQYEGIWRKKTAEAARVISNPGGTVPLSDNSQDEVDATENIRESISSVDEDIALKPVYSDHHRYFTFPNYEFGVLSSENDEIVENLNENDRHNLQVALIKLIDKNILPVIRDAAVFAIKSFEPGALISARLYDYIKENYTKYWLEVINSVIIKEKKLHYISNERLEEIYDTFTPEILSMLFSEGTLSIEQYLEGKFKFLLDRLFREEAPEFKDLLRANIDRLSSYFLYYYKIYTIFPEECREKIIEFTNSKFVNGLNSLKNIIDISFYIPDAVDLVRKDLENGFEDIFGYNYHAIAFIKRFSIEKRQTFYPLLLSERNNPLRIFSKIASSSYLLSKETHEAVSQIIREVPQHIWDEMALKILKEQSVYFFMSGILKFISFSENIIKIGFNYVFDDTFENKDKFKKLFHNKEFNNLFKEYGLTEEQFLKIYKNFDGDEISQYNFLSKLLQNHISSIIQKTKENQNLSSKDIDFILHYFNNKLYKADSDGYENLNIILEILNQVDNKNERKKLQYTAKELFSYIYKSEEPFLSERAFRNLMIIASDSSILLQNLLKTSDNDRPFDDWLPMSKMVDEPSEDLLRFYAEIIVTRKPELLFETTGRENVNIREYFINEDLNDKELLNKLYGIDHELINEIIQKTDPETFKKSVEKIREGIKKKKENREEDKIPLIKRFPDLLVLAIKNMSFTRYLLYEKLLNYIRLVYHDVNTIPESIADIVYKKIFSVNTSVKNPLIEMLFDNKLELNKSELIEVLKKRFPEKYALAIKKAVEIDPVSFLNSEFGRNRNEYENEIFFAIKKLDAQSSLRDNYYSNIYLNNEFKEFICEPQNEDIFKAVFDRASEVDAVEKLLSTYPDLIKKVIDLNMAIISFSHFRKLENLEVAKNMYKILKNDYPVERLPEEIKISKSIYQQEQRPHVLEDNIRYTISNNNINPTPVLYDIGKKLIHAGDGVQHTNIGVSGFTNSWALVSFIKITEDKDADKYENTILIEQYQSDYPPVLHILFGGQERGGGEEGRRALQALIKKHGDQDAIQKYKELHRASNPSEDIEIPIDLAPMVKDARTHFEYISKIYPYLAIANTIKTAKALGLLNICILADAPRYAHIKNKDKADRLYIEIPKALGKKIYDYNYSLDLWKIPATDEILEKLEAMIQEIIGKSKDYDFYLTPAQNKEREKAKLEEEQRKKIEWNSTPEKEKELNNIEIKIRNILPELEVPKFFSPQEVLKFLGEEVKGKVLTKKQFNAQFSTIMRDLGLLSRAARRKERMIKIATLYYKY